MLYHLSYGPFVTGDAICRSAPAIASRQELPGRQDLPVGSAGGGQVLPEIHRVSAPIACDRVARVVLCGRRMLQKLLPTLLAPLAFTGCLAGADAPTSTAAQDLAGDACPDGVPGNLAPTADEDLAFHFDATGVQIYTCNATATGGYAWSFVAPDADLYLPNNDHNVVAHHFAGPTWQYIDGSAVVARKVAGATVDPGSIPWLWLVATSHDGDGRFANVTSIQRLSTHGGNAPATGCDAAHVGAEADVPYTAGYYFYVARDPNKPNNTRCGA